MAVWDGNFAITIIRIAISIPIDIMGDGHTWSGAR